MENPINSLKALVPVEELAEEILRDKSEVVAIDRRRNENREGIRALLKMKEEKVWMAVGPLLVRLPKEKAKTMLNEDQNVLDVEVNKIRSELKVKVNKLRDLEFEEPVPGLHLKPLTKDEFAAVGQVLGYHA
ncbi:unnamed protein product [Nezara viridula]|uniref:P53 and DNA damage-regulated protein 1 n=1 Tax=Nezara viridula TaxID=85310 RepID=A0A9P0MX69_NEZVI|nr:unnamed protein product [Nezara viridula]